jgi:transposase-like protein
MSQTVTTQQEEVQALKTYIDKLRSKGGRRQFPESVRRRVLALRKAGWSVRPLAGELGIAGSQIYSWAKEQQNSLPHVLQVEPQAPSRVITQEIAQALSPGSLQLRLGTFCITVAVVEQE